VVLHGAATELAKLAGITTLHLSLTHTSELAAAFVIGTSEEELGAR
jgi:phosphopantetheinyl transferase (holo-ACP synthase)